MQLRQNCRCLILGYFWSRKEGKSIQQSSGILRGVTNKPSTPLASCPHSPVLSWLLCCLLTCLSPHSTSSLSPAQTQTWSCCFQAWILQTTHTHEINSFFHVSWTVLSMPISWCALCQVPGCTLFSKCGSHVFCVWPLLCIPFPAFSSLGG